MPIYEYHCENCGEDFEYLVFGREEPDCTSCESTNVNKLMSACGFISKGNGGKTVKTSASTSSCNGCTAGSCSSCGN